MNTLLDILISLLIHFRWNSTLESKPTMYYKNFLYQLNNKYMKEYLKWKIRIKRA